MSPTALTLNTATTIALTMVCVGVLKAFLEVWVPPDNRLHDSAVQLLALLIGVAWSFAFLWVDPVGRGAGLQAITSVILGLTGGSASIGTYHVMTAVKRSAATVASTQDAPPRVITVPAGTNVSVTVPPPVTPPGQGQPPATTDSALPPS